MNKIIKLANDKFPKESGIYGIRNKITNQIYIGQTNNLYKRMLSRRNILNKQCNRLRENKILWNSWQKYGEEYFEFLLIEKCKTEILNEREKYWINYFGYPNTEKCFNLDEGGRKRLYKSSYKPSEETKLKISNSEKGKITSDYTKQKISKTLMGRSYPTRLKPNKDKTITRNDISTRNSGTGNGRSKLTLEDCNEIKELLKTYGIKEISKILKISEFPIGQIKRNRHWSCNCV